MKKLRKSVFAITEWKADQTPRVFARTLPAKQRVEKKERTKGGGLSERQRRSIAPWCQHRYMLHRLFCRRPIIFRRGLHTRSITTPIKPQCNHQSLCLAPSKLKKQPLHNAARIRQRTLLVELLYTGSLIIDAACIAHSLCCICHPKVRESGKIDRVKEKKKRLRPKCAALPPVALR